VVHQYDVDDAKTIHDFLDFLVQKIPLDDPEEGFSFIEDIIDLRKCLLELVHRMLLLNVMQSALDVQDLQFDHMQQFLALVRKNILLLRLFLLYTFLPNHRIL
jgi:hypothetical protein